MRMICYISADKHSAICPIGNSYEEFVVGEIVGHQDENVGKAKILSFSIDEEDGSVIAHTSEGTATLPYLVKTKKNQKTLSSCKNQK